MLTCESHLSSCPLAGWWSWGECVSTSLEVCVKVKGAGGNNGLPCGKGGCTDPKQGGLTSTHSPLASTLTSIPVS